MKLLLPLVLSFLLYHPSTGCAQTFNPVNRYLVSGNAYAFTGVSDTGRDLLRIKLKTLDLFQQRLSNWKSLQASGVAVKTFAGLDTMFRNSAFEACKDVIIHSGMVRYTSRSDSVAGLIRKDQFHAVAATYDTASGILPVYFWCQGYVWKQTVQVSLENATAKASKLDRYDYYALLPNWALIRGNLCPTRIAEDRDFKMGGEPFTVPEKVTTPIRFSLKDILPDADLPTVSFDYTTEANAYLATIVPGPVAAPISKKQSVLLNAERMPEFKGNLQKYLGSHLKYPEKARAGGVEGFLMLVFVISEHGGIKDVQVERGTGSEMLDAEGIRVLESMPDWKPGYQRNEAGEMQAVDVYYRLPLTFSLD